MMNRAVSYLLVFAISTGLFGSLALLSTMVGNLAGCNTIDSRPGNFLAECNSFGNYEHGAFFYGLEPLAVNNLQNADVLLLGNSHMQYAFSGDIGGAFFAARGLHHFLLGFGYIETSDFVRALAERYGLRPKILIINADPFFSRKRGLPAQQILGMRAPLTRIEYLFKAAAITVSSAMCVRVQTLCGGQTAAIYRSRINGQWLVNGIQTGKLVPIDAGKSPAPSAIVEEATSIGKDFLAGMKVDPSCVVLTGIPGGNDDPYAVALASQLAERLGTKILNIIVPDMVTIDGSHMTPDTVRRWSAEFFDKLPKVLEGCPAFKSAKQA
jgi:hypothetical protein